MQKYIAILNVYFFESKVIFLRPRPIRRIGANPFRLFIFLIKKIELTELNNNFSSGMGYIVGSGAGAAAGDWRWGLRVTPFLGAVAVVLIIWVMRDPQRGEAEDSHMKPTSYSDDIRSLIRK